MKTVKVSIQDEHTLVLQEDAAKGDVIDLATLHETDIDQTTIKNVVNSIKKDAFNTELQKATQAIEREKALEAQVQHQELQGRLAELKAKLESSALQADTEKRLAVTEAVNKVEAERNELTSELKSKETERQLLESNLKDKYENELRTKDEMIAYYKDMKAKLSTKMVGESLEQHCETEFNKLRATAFPNAYFEKDNDAKTGSKGDFIYREVDENGTEIISIMFEMKNEGDETATKKKIS